MEKDWIQSSFIYLNMFILNSRFLSYPIIYTLLNNLVDSQKKIPEKENNPLEVFTVFAKDLVEKENASKQWCFCCSRVNGHSKTRYASL